MTDVHITSGAFGAQCDGYNHPDACCLRNVGHPWQTKRTVQSRKNTALLRVTASSATRRSFLLDRLLHQFLSLLLQLVLLLLLLLRLLLISSDLRFQLLELPLYLR